MAKLKCPSCGSDDLSYGYGIHPDKTTEPPRNLAHCNICDHFWDYPVKLKNILISAIEELEKRDNEVYNDPETKAKAEKESRKNYDAFMKDKDKPFTR